MHTGIGFNATNQLPLADASYGAFQAELVYVDPDNIQLASFGQGARVDLLGDVETLTAPRVCARTDNLLAADGTDSGGAPVADTVYYAYASNGRASYAPNSVRLSATAPTLSVGRYVLAAAGNGATWLYIGSILTEAAAATFGDALTRRGVDSYFNPKRRELYANPGYVDDALQTSIAFTSAAWALLNAGVGDQVTFVLAAQKVVTLEAYFSVSAGAGGFRGGLGTAANEVIAEARTAGSVSGNTACGRSLLLAAGRHTYGLYGLSGVASNVFCDGASNGSAADVPATMLVGIC